MKATLAFLGALLAPLALLSGPAQRRPTRVGMLNTGELVLIDDSDRAQVITAATTALIRDTLIHTDFADSELVLFPQGGTSARPAP